MNKTKRLYMVVLFGLVARVLFCEGGGANLQEKELIMSVIVNRAEQLKVSTTSRRVLNSSNFCSIRDKKNKNWPLSERLESGYISNIPAVNKAWKDCKRIESGEFKRNKEVFYFHDKSISKPASWDNNKYWLIEAEIETEKFIFYSITKRSN